MRKSLSHLAPLGGLLCLALAAGPGTLAFGADENARLVALGGEANAAALLDATSGPLLAQASNSAPAVNQTAQASPQDDAQLAAVVARVCPTLETCRQALAGLLVRLNTTQQQLVNAQEKIRQLQDFVRLVESARQTVRQNPELAGQGLSGDAAAVVEQLQLQLGLSAAEIQTLSQARDQALAALEKATAEARAKAQTALAQSQEVQRLQARLTALGADGDAAASAQDGAQLGTTAPTADSAATTARSPASGDVAVLLKERDVLRAEIQRLNSELRDGRLRANGSQSPGQSLLGRAPSALKGQLDRLQDDVERLDNANKRLEAANQIAGGRIDGLQSRLTEALVRIEELRAERDRLLAQVEGGQAPVFESDELVALRTRLANNQIALEQAQAEIKRLAQTAEAIGTGGSQDGQASAGSSDQQAALQARLEALAEERDLAVQQMQATQARLQGLEMADAAREQEQRAREALAVQLADLESELEQQRTTIAALRAEKGRLEQQIEEAASLDASDVAGSEQLQSLQQELQATKADKAALERQLIKLETGRRTNREELDRLAEALQQRDQTIAALQAQVAGGDQSSGASQTTFALQQAQKALADEQATRAQERADFQRLLEDLQAKNQQLVDALTRVQAAAATEKENLVAEIVRLTDEAREFREFVDLQRLQSGDQQDAVARLTQALEDAERQRAAQLDLLGRAQNEIEALLTELGQARNAASNSEAQKQKAIDDALRLRKLLDDLIKDRDALAQEVAALKQAGQRDQRAQELLASTQQQMREIETERDVLRRELGARQREVLDLTRQLQRRQDFIASQKAVGRNYDMLAEQLNDSEAQLILARMQVSNLQQKLQSLEQGPNAGLNEAAPREPSDQSSTQPSLQAQPQDVPVDQLEGARIPGVDPAQDERTLRLLEELRRIGRPKAPALDDAEG